MGTRLRCIMIVAVMVLSSFSVVGGGKRDVELALERVPLVGLSKSLLHEHLDPDTMVNLSAFELLSNQSLSLPFQDDISTVWSGLQFLCRTFGSRDLNGCSDIAALSVNSASAQTMSQNASSSLVGEARRRNTSLNVNGTLGLFRFLQADPSGFSHMTLTLGNGAKEPLADEASQHKELLRRELERKIFALSLKIDKLHVENRSLELNVEFCDQMLMTIRT